MNAKHLAAILIFLALAAFAQSSDSFHGIPYHPYRYAGARYWSLQPFYDRLQGKGAAELPEGWQECFSHGVVDYIVDEVLEDGLLVRRKTDFSWSRLYLINYPNRAGVVDGQRINFIALRIGNRQYHDSQGIVHTVPLYDYGVPYNPFTLAQSRTNRPATNSSQFSAK